MDMKEAWTYGMDFYEYDKYNFRGSVKDRCKINETYRINKNKIKADIILSKRDEDYDNCTVVLYQNGKKAKNVYDVFFIVKNTIVLKMKKNEYDTIYKHGILQPNQFNNTRNLDIIAKHFYDNCDYYYSF